MFDKVSEFQTAKVFSRSFKDIENGVTYDIWSVQFTDFSDKPWDDRLTRWAWSESRDPFKKFFPNIVFGIGEARHFKFRVLSLNDGWSRDRFGCVVLTFLSHVEHIFLPKRNEMQDFDQTFTKIFRSAIWNHAVGGDHPSRTMSCPRRCILIPQYFDSAASAHDPSYWQLGPWMTLKVTFSLFENFNCSWNIARIYECGASRGPSAVAELLVGNDSRLWVQCVTVLVSLSRHAR